jgi:hypothetical protein
MPNANYAAISTGSNDSGDLTYRNTTNQNRTTFLTTSFKIFSQGVNQSATAREDSGNINVVVFA